MPRLPYPDAPRLDLVEDLHGHQVADPYRWLEDADDERTAAWSTQQDELFAQARDTWPGKERLRQRVTELVAAGMVSVPVWRGERQFVLRRAADQEHAVLLTVDPAGTERVLIDPMALDPT
ncbi:MAG TPA: S9 family peptidase, partial [Actinomycetes bacterium]|nr:S9 family peptidase [Actinomycetes bacterium]